jgi:hypothetical protein
MSSSQLVMEFPLLSRKSVQVDFTGGLLSSDGGLLLLARLDRSLGLTERVAACLKDDRRPDRVHHSLLDLIRQRVYQIAAGYEDANDATSLRHDPALKLSVGRAPLSGAALASQPTLSRLEATISEAECDAINQVLLAQFLALPRHKPRAIVLDLDTSEHQTHGQQELALYNGHYGHTCYLPRFFFAHALGEPDQFLVASELPDHQGNDTEAILGTLSRLVRTIRTRWPNVPIVLRADAGFADPALYTFLEEQEIAYTLAIAGNGVLHAKSQPLRERAAKEAAASGEQRAVVYGKVWYQAQSWERGRNVAVKVEQTPTGTSVRYVVVSGVVGKAKEQYAFYGGRGDSENRIKELKEGLRSDRMSCREYASNKVRLLLTSVAYVLLQGLRRLARGTQWATAQVERLRLCVIKIGARVKESGRRVVVELCSSYPWQELFRLLVRQIEILGR